VPIPFDNARFGIHLHCHYKQEQIIAALTGDSRSSLARTQAGVLYLPEHKFDVFFVTLNKSPERYSPTTMYQDYPLSRDLFHWQSMGVQPNNPAEVSGTSNTRTRRDATALCPYGCERRVR
jgi:hypothetical protein